MGRSHDDQHALGPTTLEQELERWREKLLSGPREGRNRHEKNDAYLARRMAMRIFGETIDRSFRSPTATGMLSERFAALVRYRNPSAQASR